MKKRNCVLNARYVRSYHRTDLDVGSLKNSLGGSVLLALSCLQLEWTDVTFRFRVLCCRFRCLHE